MDSWFERGRPAIFEAITNVCQTIDRELRAELDLRRPALRDAGTCTVNEHVAESKLAVIDRLEKENVKLRAQLAAMTSNSTSNRVTFATNDDEEISRELPPSTFQFPLTPAAEVPRPCPVAAQGEVSEFVKLQMRFNALLDNFKKAKEALQKRKDERDRWVDRARLLERKIKAAENEHGIQILDRSNRVGRDGKNSTSFTSSFASDDEITRPEVSLPPLVPTTSTNNDHGAGAEDPQLQSTQGEPDEESEGLPSLPSDNEHQGSPILKQEPSSDTPVVVSERVLKRRKLDDDVSAVAEVRRIKPDPNESSPVPSLEHYGLNIQESLDLDDIGPRMQTPRKRKEIGDSQEEEESYEPSVQSMTPTPLFVRPDPPQPPADIVHGASVLTPISGNKRIAKPTLDKPKTPALKYGLSHGISVLAEDGGIYGKNALQRKPKSSNTPNTAIKGRLDTLLNSPAPENRSAINRSGQALQPILDSPQDGLLIPERRELPFDRAMRQGNRRPGMDPNMTPRLKAPDQRTPARDRSPQRSRNVNSALRRKPLSELRLDDFKVNPSVNDGQDFAYSEVVRDKDDRACLRGCTDAHCCGKQFRALALSQRPNPPLTAAQRQEEQKLLENYLGDYSYRLATMTKEERAEVWVEAKTEELANKYGKHRHRFSRMRSPPGFWNADFPDTQELEADKEEASKRERQAITERYREATRSGGRWLFRDE